MTEPLPVVPSVGAVPVEVPEEAVEAATRALSLCTAADAGLDVFARLAVAAAYPLIAAARVRAETIAELSTVDAAEGAPGVAEMQRWANQTPDRYARDAVLAAADAVERMQRTLARVRAEERQRIAAMIQQDAETLNAFAPGCTAELVAYLVGSVMGAGSAVPVATPEHDVRCERAYGQEGCFCQRRADVEFSHTATGPVATPKDCGEASATRGWAPCDREPGHDGPHTWPLILPVATPTEPVRDLCAELQASIDRARGVLPAKQDGQR